MHYAKDYWYYTNSKKKKNPNRFECELVIWEIVISCQISEKRYKYNLDMCRNILTKKESLFLAVSWAHTCTDVSSSS